MTTQIYPSAMDTQIREWLEVFAGCVRRVDYASARSLFYPDVTCYGSSTDTAYGIEDLETRQWKMVWPHIDDFRFDLEGMTLKIASGLKMAFVHTRWFSIGYHPDNTTFLRPGRVTLLMGREDTASEWRASHSHFSLNPGTSLRTQRRTPKLSADKSIL